MSCSFFGYRSFAIRGNSPFSAGYWFWSAPAWAYDTEWQAGEATWFDDGNWTGGQPGWESPYTQTVGVHNGGTALVDDGTKWARALNLYIGSATNTGTVKVTTGDTPGSNGLRTNDLHLGYDAGGLGGNLGSLIVDGGVHQAAQKTYIDETGRYYLKNGTFEAWNYVQIFTGGSFEQTGGTYDQGINAGHVWLRGGTYKISDGTLTADVAGVYHEGGTFHVSRFRCGDHGIRRRLGVQPERRRYNAEVRCRQPRHQRD